MATKMSERIRVDPRFKAELEEAARIRVDNRVEKRTPTSQDMTRMVMNTEAWKQMIKELSIKPRKENLI